MLVFLLLAQNFAAKNTLNRMAMTKRDTRAAISGVEEEGEEAAAAPVADVDERFTGDEGMVLPPVEKDGSRVRGVDNGVVEGEAKRERVEVGVGVEEGDRVEVVDGTTTVTGWGCIAATRLSAES